MNILQVHSRGCELGKKFSAFNAKIKFNNRFDSIEKIYQESKRFNGDKLDYKSAKGKKPDSFEINGKQFPEEKLSQFYYSLWAIYYLNNPLLVNQASNYDDFKDIFKGKSVNCQEDTLRLWIRDRGKYLEFIKPFLNLLKEELKWLIKTQTK